MDFSTTDDIFLNTKGKAFRNKQKKLDKIIATEKQAKKGEITLTDAQKEMIAEKEKLQNECKELKDQLDLYVKSHPACLAPPEPAPK